MPEQSRPVADRLRPRKLQRRHKGALKAVGGIGIVVQQPISGLPDQRSVLPNEYGPISHEYIPDNVGAVNELVVGRPCIITRNCLLVASALSTLLYFRTAA